MRASNQVSTPTVAVVGALGVQGSSVIRALKSSSIASNWNIRALTSSPGCDSAQSLSKQANVSIVYCDVNDLNSIRDAFKGCTHIFANTAFSGSILMSDGQKAAEKLESDQGMNLVRAAAATDSLVHFVWSTLMDSSLLSGGKWKVPHFMSKQAANAYILGGYPGGSTQQQAEAGWGNLRAMSTLLAIGIYGSNLQFHSYRPVRKDIGSDAYIVRLPISPDLPFPIAGDETVNVGILVRAIFEQPKKSKGTWVPCEPDNISCRQWVAGLNEAAKRQGWKGSVTFEECTMKSLEERWGVLGNEIGQMMKYVDEVKDRSFENTSGLMETRAIDLGVDNQLVPSSKFYDGLDCLALMREVESGTTHLGAAGRK